MHESNVRQTFMLHDELLTMCRQRIQMYREVTHCARLTFCLSNPNKELKENVCALCLLPYHPGTLYAAK